MLSREEMDNRKNRIAYTAYRLFISKGIRCVTMAEIAKKAKVGENTIYRYYPTKTVLILEAQKMVWDNITQFAVAATAKHDDFAAFCGIQQMSVLIDILETIYMEFSGFARFCYEFKLYLLEKNVQITPAEYTDMTEPFYELSLSILLKGQQDGSITVQCSAVALYHSLWEILRGYLEKMALYSKIYAGDSPYPLYFGVVKTIIMNALKSGGSFHDTYVAEPVDYRFPPGYLP